MESTDQLLRRLIGRGAVAAVQVRTGSGGFEMRSRFLKEGNNEGDHGIWVQLTGGDAGLVDRLIESSSPVLVQIEDGPRQFSFVSSLLVRRKALLGEERVLLGWPAAIKTRERRRSPREPVPASATITAALIRVGDAYLPGGGLAVQFVDLSPDGARLLCSTAIPVLPRPGDGLELRLRFAGSEHRIATRLCRAETLPDGQTSLGIEFTSDGMPAETGSQLTELLESLRTCRVRSGLNRTLVKGMW